jgi:ubiquinone/menaquinone biosynthesis C-methylase UbiE
MNNTQSVNAIQQYKEGLKATFNSAEGYDAHALRFFKNSADFFASCLDLSGDEQVIDIATGTGNAALALSGRLPRGHITAVDFSRGMLDIARKKASSMDIRNITFREMDMQELDFGTGQFDAALSAFGIFFAPDMDAQLARMASIVKPGGQIAICSFRENYFEPLRGMTGKRLEQYGCPLPPPLWKKVASEDHCTEFFASAGIKNIRVEKANHGYFLTSENQWWDIIRNTGMRGTIDRLTPENRQKFKEELMREIAGLAQKEGIWLDVEVLYTLGIK